MRGVASARLHSSSGDLSANVSRWHVSQVEAIQTAASSPTRQRWRDYCFGNSSTQSRTIRSEFARADRLSLRFSLDAGVLETTPFQQFGSLYHANVHLHDVLVAKGYDVSFRTFPGGHDYFWWRETIADGLIALLGA